MASRRTTADADRAPTARCAQGVFQLADLTAHDGSESWIDALSELVEILTYRRSAQHVCKPVPDQVSKIHASLRVNGYKIAIAFVHRAPPATEADIDYHRFCCGGRMGGRRGAAVEGIVVDYVGYFGQEVAAFEAAGREAVSSQAAPPVPSCPGWVATDLVLHLGRVHRIVARVIAERLQQPPAIGDWLWLELPGQWLDWLPPCHAPTQSALPPALLDWFHAGAATLQELFSAVDPDERVWTWSSDQCVGFWKRMQAIEAAVHRWDAQNAVSAAEPIDAALATDAILQTFEVMAPMRRAVAKASPGQGESYVFRRTDGPGTWAVHFDSDAVLLGTPDGSCDIQISGTASDLALFLWQRDVTASLDLQGDSSLVSRYFDLVPPL